MTPRTDHSPHAAVELSDSDTVWWNSSIHSAILALQVASGPDQLRVCCLAAGRACALRDAVATTLGRKEHRPSPNAEQLNELPEQAVFAALCLPAFSCPRPRSPDQHDTADLDDVDEGTPPHQAALSRACPPPGAPHSSMWPSLQGSSLEARSALVVGMSQ